MRISLQKTQPNNTKKGLLTLPTPFKLSRDTIFIFSVRPNKANVSAVGSGPHSLTVRFSVPHELAHFPPGLRSDVRYRSQFDPEGNWTRVDTSNLMDPHKEHYATDVAGLLPYAEYTVQVRLLSAKVSVFSNGTR